MDNAILGYLNADERKVDAKRIAQLLAHGAHALQAPDEDAAKEGEAFAQEASRFPYMPTSVLSCRCWHVPQSAQSCTPMDTTAPVRMNACGMCW